MKRLFLWQVYRRRLYFGITVLLLAIILGLWGIEALEDYELAKADNQPASPPTGELRIIIKLSQRRLEVYNDGKVYKRYRVAAGKQATPSPVGEWKVVYKSHTVEDRFGTRWMGLDVPWGSYGIHGTNMPWSIGFLASGGCIRMGKTDVEELYEWIPLGTMVRIEGKRIKVQQPLKLHSVGQETAILQLRLKELGYYQGRADSKFGIDTEQALKEFQRIKGLEQTGIADSATIKLLGI